MRTHLLHVNHGELAALAEVRQVPADLLHLGPANGQGANLNGQALDARIQCRLLQGLADLHTCMGGG